MKDFESMTADEIKHYKGPIFRATVIAFRTGQRVNSTHDLNYTSSAGLEAKIAHLTANGWNITSVTMGPHSPDAYLIDSKESAQ